MRKIIIEIKKMNAKRQMKNVLNVQNNSFTIVVHDLFLNSTILIFRKNETNRANAWNFFYTFFNVQNESTIIDLSNDLISFKIISIRSYHDFADDGINFIDDKKTNSSIETKTKTIEIEKTNVLK